MIKKIADRKNILKIPFASIQLTDKCNLKCGFCFRKNNIPEVSLEQINKIIKNLNEFNLGTLVLSGGEPLLRKDIKDILKITKSLGIKTVLQTNGILLKDRISELAPYIDWISISLDGFDEKTNSVMRGRGHFAKILEILPLIKKHKIKIKLGTVVTSKNYKDIYKIGNIIGPYVSTWKLYQFYPRKGTYAQENKKDFQIKMAVFKEVVEKVRQKFPNLPISSHDVFEFDKSPCMLIDPDGKVFITKKDKDIEIGDILKNPHSLKRKIFKSAIFLEISSNFNKTYKD